MLLGKSIGIVMPAFNEANFIVKTLSSIPNWIDCIVVVDDGSSDSTGEKLKYLSRQRLILLKHTNRLGVGAAVQTGYRKMLDKRMDIILTMDADGQMSSLDIPNMLDPILSDEADFVKGNRFGYRSIKSKMPFIRYFGNSFLTRFQSWSHRESSVGDSQSGFTAIRREVLEMIELGTLWTGYGFYNDLVFRLIQLPVRIVNVPVRTIYAKESSTLTLFDCFKIVHLLWSHRFKKKLLK